MTTDEVLKNEPTVHDVHASQGKASALAALRNNPNIKLGDFINVHGDGQGYDENGSYKVICKEKGLQDLPSEQELLDEQLAQDEGEAEPEVGAKRQRVVGGKTKRKMHINRRTMKGAKRNATKRKTHNKRKTMKAMKRGKK
jgi:hypothetical protein